MFESEATSTQAIKCLMLNKMCMLPNYNFPACDVRDVALCHLKAMTKPDAKNNRHIVVSRRECLSFKELALTLENEFKLRNYDIPSRMAPKCAFKLYSMLESRAKQVTRFK